MNCSVAPIAPVGSQPDVSAWLTKCVACAMWWIRQVEQANCLLAAQATYDQQPMIIHAVQSAWQYPCVLCIRACYVSVRVTQPDQRKLTMLATGPTPGNDDFTSCVIVGSRRPLSLPRSFRFSAIVSGAWAIL